MDIFVCVFGDGWVDGCVFGNAWIEEERNGWMCVSGFRDG